MRDYELIFIINPEITPAQKKVLLEKVKKLTTDLKGEIKEFTEWGKKELAYPIKKHQAGIYYFAAITLPSTAPNRLNQILRTEENLLRYLLVTVKDVKSKPQAKKPKIAPKTKVKKTPTKTKSQTKKTTAKKTKTK